MPVLSASQIAAAAQSGGFSGSQIPIMVAIALAESSGNTNASHQNGNGTTDLGLWQINSVHAAILASGNWADPVDNAKMAKQVFDSQGFGAWTTFTSGAYLTHLSVAQAGAGSPDSSFASGSTATVTSVNPLEPLVNLFTALGQPQTWVRVGEVLAGAVIIYLALKAMNGRTGLTSGLKKALV